MITNEIENEQTASEAVSFDENILNFLDYTVLLLSQANSANEVDILMDDFLSDDFIDLLVENKQLFSILGVVWMETFNRVFIAGNESSFSLKTLWIPVLFHKLDWTLEDKAALSDLHTLCLKKANNEPNVYNYLVLLFVEGMFSSLEFAFQNFTKNVTSLATTDEDKDNLKNLFDDIASLGWPRSTSPSQNNVASNPASWQFEVSSH